MQGRCWYALFYLQWTRGAFDQGVMHARRALADDPLSAYPAMILAGCLQVAGRLDEAIATARLAVERDSESFAARWVLGETLALAGRADEAVAAYHEAAGMTDSPVALSGLAFAHAQAGRTAEAARIHEELTARARERYVPFVLLASTAAAAGRHDEAIALARRAWDEREPTFMLWARHFHELRTLRATIRASTPSCGNWTRLARERTDRSSPDERRCARSAASSDSCRSAGIAIARGIAQDARRFAVGRDERDAARAAGDVCVDSRAHIRRQHSLQVVHQQLDAGRAGDRASWLRSRRGRSR